MKLLDRLKKKREELLAARERQEHLYRDNGVYAFFEKSMHFSNATTGHVYLITPDEVLEKDSPGGVSHKKVCEELLSNKFHREVNLDDPGDFGYQIANEFDTIFIRMVSIINNVSALYYPKTINEYQLRELKKFRDLIDEYNAMHKNSERAEIVFIDLNGEESHDLDKLIDDLERGVKTKK